MEITPNINNDLCLLLARTAREKAVEIDVPMVIAFADARGETVHFQRMDRALPASLDIAVNKAYTAAALRMPTHKAGPLTQPGRELYGLELTNGGKMVVFGGGFPLTLNRVVVGAIGVSGGSVGEDMTVAGAAVQAFEQMAEAARILRAILPGDLKGKALADRDFLARNIRVATRADGISPAILEGAFHLIPNKN